MSGSTLARAADELEPQLARLRDLVGGVDRRGLRVGAGDDVAQARLASGVVAASRRLGDRAHERGDALPEALLEVVEVGIGVLEHVVQHARGDDLVGVVAPAQQLRDLQRVQDERRPIGVAALARVVLGGELQRATRDRQLRDEARELGLPHW